MERVTVPHKVRREIATFKGDWTAEEIDAGLAGEPVVDVKEEWYEPSPSGPVLITDEERIQELEERLAKKDVVQL